jgi:predicted dehydrogenase
MRQPNFAIMGAGRIAAKFASTFSRGLVKNAQLLAVASTDMERAKSFAAAHKIPRAYGSYEEMLRDRDVDIVYVATTNERHFACCEKTISAGKHTLCEKPLVPTAFEARSLAGMAAGAGVFLMEALWTRFMPAVRKTAEWLREGRIGRVHAMSATLCAFRDPEEYVRLYDPRMYGGALRDLGVYCLHLAQHLTGGRSIADISGAIIPAKTGVDLSSYLRLRYEDNFVAEIRCSIAYFARNEAYICGDAGYIRIAPWFNRARRAELFTQPFADATQNKEIVPAQVFIGETPSGFEYEISHTAECVQNGKTQSDIIPVADSIRIIEITEKALGSF